MSVLTLGSYTMERNLLKIATIWKLVLLKVLRKAILNKDATLFYYVHCVSLSIFNVVTE